MSSFELNVDEITDADGYFAEITGRLKVFDGEIEEEVNIGEFKGFRIVPYSKTGGGEVSLFYDLDMYSATAEFMTLFKCDEYNLWNDQVVQRFPDIEAFCSGIFILSEVKIKPQFRGQGHFVGFLQGLTSLMNLQVVVLKSYPLQWELHSDCIDMPKGNKRKDFKSLNTYYEKLGFVCLDNLGDTEGQLMIKTYY